MILEYIWLDSEQKCRSKTKILKNSRNIDFTNMKTVPEWNYDGSSTGQATTEDSEVILRPVKVVKDPFRKDIKCDGSCWLVLCDTYNKDGTPNKFNTRHNANKIFSYNSQYAPMFGLEQEFFLSTLDDSGNKVPVCFGLDMIVKEQGDYYCGVGFNNAIGRDVIENVLNNLMYSDIPITGLNAEVAPSQWEFQVCSTGIDAADSLVLLRYICNRTIEENECIMDLTAKPVGDINGSGCHVNFSTREMRDENGYDKIKEAIDNLSKNHQLHIKHYGAGNELRLTGIHETSSIDKFSYGVGSRDTSIRIPHETFKNKRGYFEDRRPSSELDPYIVTALLFATSCNIEQDYYN